MNDPGMQIILCTLLGFFAGASIAIEANVLVGIIIILLTIIISPMAYFFVNKKIDNKKCQKDTPIDK